MLTTENIEETLQTWAPQLVDTLKSLSYLGSESSIAWLRRSRWSAKFEAMVHVDGHSVAAEMWSKELKEKENLPAPAILLILEHLRRRPAKAFASMASLNFEASKTLALVASRAAGALHEDAKQSFASDEIDIAIARFLIALSEFRFSIESECLSDATRRIATGKYATAVAMIGRWINVSEAAVSRALTYSRQSMDLGNKSRETVLYRLELLVLQFDQTGDAQLLHDALKFLSESHLLSEGSELAEAEARFRLALLSNPKSREARRYLEGAERKILAFRPKNGMEDARRTILVGLISEFKMGRLSVAARSVAIPKGLLVCMASSPSAELWVAIRRLVSHVESIVFERGGISHAVMGARLLRRIIAGPETLLQANDVSRYLDLTQWLAERVLRNRHFQWEAGAAALSAAKRTGNLEFARNAHLIFAALASEFSTWPLPRIGIARVREYLREDLKNGASSTDDGWRDAAALALKSAAYVRANLGGRNEVFAVSDVRGFLSETFVFKRTTKDKAEYEARMLRLLRDEVIRLGGANRFEVPRSLAIVEVDSQDQRRWVHVSQRTAGRLVSELRPGQALEILGLIVEFLAVFHRVAGSPAEGQSGWASLKNSLRMWAKTLFDPGRVDLFVGSLRHTFPPELPLVRKRDAHASNWLVDPAGRIVAIDLESTNFVPIGFDVAQLIEDNALIQADGAGWLTRLALMKDYLNHLGVSALGDSKIADVYGWFAITRALRLGTESEAGKQLRRHARELCGMLVEFGSESISEVARELLQALSRVEQTEMANTAPSHDHRRLSKSMAYQLRHHGPDNGVPVDAFGFASMEELAAVLKVDSANLLAVAEHPGEPRFEVRDGQIRALYGHSLDVFIDVSSKIGMPTSLYHGSSWSSLDAIVRQGLMPMQRQMVHLTNTAAEARSVGERKGSPLIFEIAQSQDEEPVAEGIWVVAAVLPERIAIVNPFIDEVGAVR